MPKAKAQAKESKMTNAAGPRSSVANGMPEPNPELEANNVASGAPLA